jgi:hypothetical protein
MGELMVLVLGLGSQELLILVFPVASIALCLWALFDAASRPESQWVAAGQSKGLWLTIITVVALVSCSALGWFGALLYALIPRRAMTRVTVQQTE